MEITVVTGFSTIGDVNIYSGQSYTFDVKVIVFEKISLSNIPNSVSNHGFCSGEILPNQPCELSR